MSNESNQNIFNSENLLSFIFSKWKPLLIVAILGMIGSTLVALYVLPEKFKAKVILFPAQSNNLARGFLSEESDGTKDFLAYGEDNNADQLLQILKSDALMWALEKKFDLIHYYGLQDKWDKYYLFKGYYGDLFQYDVTQYESLEINVIDLYPKKAAEMANAAAQLADSIMRQVIKQRATAALKVAKHEYDSAVAFTNKLEDSIQFYHNLGILNWQYQTKELTAGYDDALVKGNAQAAKEIGDKLAIFEKYGNGFLTLSNQLEGSYQWFKQATASYMQAKANAEESIPSFFIVDKAIPADRKSYPVRALVILMGTAVPLIFALLLLLIINRLKGIRAKVKQ
jgi:LPS O-antigen subunit length determinant protein (WzzB/FepE family)